MVLSSVWLPCSLQAEVLPHRGTWIWWPQDTQVHCPTRLTWCLNPLQKYQLVLLLQFPCPQHPTVWMGFQGIFHHQWLYTVLPFPHLLDTWMVQHVSIKCLSHLSYNTYCSMLRTSKRMYGKFKVLVKKKKKEKNFSVNPKGVQPMFLLDH